MSGPLKKSICLAILAALVAGFSHRGIRGNTVSGTPGLCMELPEIVGPWKGQPGEPGAAEKAKLPPDTEIVKMIYSANETNLSPLQVTIVLSGKDRTSIHRPEVCLAAQGWNIDSSEAKTVGLKNGKTLKTRVLAISRDNVEKTEKIRGTYTYWFVGTDFTTEDHAKRILYTATNNFIYQTNPRWAYVSVLSLGICSESASHWMQKAVPEFQNVYKSGALF